VTDDSVEPQEAPAVGTFASSPCCLHEMESAHAELTRDLLETREVARWRKAERQRPIAARRAPSIAVRERCAARVAAGVCLIPTASAIVSSYWPFRDELDVMAWMAVARVQGIHVALPVVIASALPLFFPEWYPPAQLEPSVCKVRVPADGVEVIATIVVAPLVGFDADGYRLGHGGGFFDRVLATLPPKPVAISVGHPAVQFIFAAVLIAAQARILAAFGALREPMLDLSPTARVAAFAGFVVTYASLHTRREAAVAGTGN